jgi:hypothetical protein
MGYRRAGVRDAELVDAGGGMRPVAVNEVGLGEYRAEVPGLLPFPLVRVPVRQARCHVIQQAVYAASSRGQWLSCMSATPGCIPILRTTCCRSWG